MERRLLVGVLIAYSLALAQGALNYNQRRILAAIDSALAVRQGHRVADVGAGESAMLPAHLARTVGPRGRVTCVDISEQALEKLQHNIRKESIRNIDVVLGKSNDPNLPGNAFDSVVISYAYHEMTEHRAILDHILQALKPGGRLVILEAISEGARKEPRAAQEAKHEISPELAEKELRQAGFEIVSVTDPFYKGAKDKPGVVRWLIAARRPPAP